MGLKDHEKRREYQREYYKKNSDKIKKMSSEFRKNNKERISECRTITSKKYRIEKEYNISIEEYYTCMNTSNVCEVCGIDSNLVYDHDHTTMKFRGVLCSRCNVAIGILGDNEQGLLNALNYIKSKT